MRLPTLPYTTGSLLSYPLLSIFSPLFLFFIFHFSFFIFHFSFFIFYFTIHIFSSLTAKIFIFHVTQLSPLSTLHLICHWHYLRYWNYIPRFHSFWGFGFSHCWRSPPLGRSGRNHLYSGVNICTNASKCINQCIYVCVRVHLCVCTNASPVCVCTSVSMCMYECIYVYVRVYLFVCTSVSMCMYECIYVYVRVYLCVFTSVSMCMYECIYLYVRVYLCVCTSVSICMYECIYLCVRMYLCECTNVSMCACECIYVYVRMNAFVKAHASVRMWIIKYVRIHRSFCKCTALFHVLVSHFTRKNDFGATAPSYLWWFTITPMSSSTPLLSLLQLVLFVLYLSSQ